MGELIDDDVLNVFVVVTEPDGIAPKLIKRYAGVVDRCSFYAPYKSEPEKWAAVIKSLAGRGTPCYLLASRIDVAHRSGSCCGPKWPRPGQISSVPCGSRSAMRVARGGAMSCDASPHATSTDDSMRGSCFPRAVARRHRVHRRFHVGRALQLEHAVAAVA